VTAEELAEVIEDLLRSLAEDEDGDAEELQGATLASFRRPGLLTNDAGVVVTLDDSPSSRSRSCSRGSGTTKRKRTKTSAEPLATGGRSLTALHPPVARTRHDIDRSCRISPNIFFALART
jgi:hypothetical protein